MIYLLSEETDLVAKFRSASHWTGAGRRGRRRRAVHGRLTPAVGDFEWGRSHNTMVNVNGDGVKRRRSGIHGLLRLIAVGVLVAGTAERPYAQAPAAAPAGTRELLNSERIAERFGSYGIEVIESDGRVRVSNLFSGREGERTCRTFAIVRYPDRVDPAVAAEHDRIVRGGSIGAVFAARGWNVGKTHLRFFEIAASPRVGALMHVAAGTRLAADAYVLDVRKDGRTIEYATLVEIHHPAYLALADLLAIYGPADAAGRDRALEALLATAREKAGR